MDLLIQAIESEKNFAIHIDNWAQVNFLDFAEVAGLLGPIEVTVTYQNRYFLRFDELHADGAFDQFDTKAPVFAWTPLHESL